MRYLISGFSIFGTLLIAFLAVAFLHGFVDHITCNPELFWSNTCYDIEVRPLLVAYEHLAVAFVCLSVGVMAVYSSVDLNHQVAVIRTSYIIGGLLLFLITAPMNRYDLLASGLLVGLALSAYLSRRVRKAANHSLKLDGPNGPPT